MLLSLICVPLASTFCKAKLERSRELFELALIYVGLLSFHLLIPPTPLDPGVKPAAKVKEWESHLLGVSSNLISTRMESGLNNGNFYPNSPAISSLLNEASFCQNKMKTQIKKRVGRPKNVPTFRQLFNEVQHFANTIASVQNVLNMINSISCQDQIYWLLDGQLTPHLEKVVDIPLFVARGLKVGKSTKRQGQFNDPISTAR